jgi:hypothetical protein
MRGGEIDPTEPGEAPENPLPEAGKLLRSVEGLVIEADRKERRQPIQHARAVGLQAAEGVDRSDRQPVGERFDVAAHVEPLPRLKQRVYVVIRHRQHAARPVVLETPAEHAYAARKQRAAQGVAGEARMTGALELEGQGFRAVDPLARDRRQSRGHCAASSPHR